MDSQILHMTNWGLFFSFCCLRLYGLRRIKISREISLIVYYTTLFARTRLLKNCILDSHTLRRFVFSTEYNRIYFFSDSYPVYGHACESWTRLPTAGGRVISVTEGIQSVVVLSYSLDALKYTHNPITPVRCERSRSVRGIQESSQRPGAMHEA